MCFRCTLILQKSDEGTYETLTIRSEPETIMPSGKPKSFLNQAKGKKGKKQLLEDADDYLAAATESEDAMGKHRGGDPLKSLRFARRALDLYSQGLSRYPGNLDLAYNKARLELEISTHPVLVKHLDVPIDSILQQALESHRYALGIDSENADLLFNMSQLLTTIAERIAENNSKSDAEAIQYLEDALKYQSACFEIQKTKYQEIRQQLLSDSFHDDEDDDDEDDGGARLGAEITNPATSAEQDEQWFSVVEPVTAETLLDTVLAQLETLTTLCSIVNTSLPFQQGLVDQVNPSQIESYSSKILLDVLPDVLRIDTAELRARGTEIEMTKANFVAGFLELTFRTGSMSAPVYRENLSAAFSSQVFSSDPSALLARARAFLAFDNACTEILIHASSTSLPGQSEYGKNRWNTLTEVQNMLTTASQLATNEPALIATTHGLRGDISLSLFGLSKPPYDHPQALSNRIQLLRNAEVFYRNATKLFEAQGIEYQDDKETSRFRGAIVQVLQQREIAGAEALPASNSNGERRQVKINIQSIPMNSLTKPDMKWRIEQLEEMIDNGLIDRELFTDT